MMTTFWTLLSFWLLGIFLPATLSQQQRGAPPLQPLGDVLMLVMDSDKDQSVTMSEVQSQLKMLEALFSQGDSPEGSEYLGLLRGIQSVAPQLFELLDVNGDKVLKQWELKFMEKLDKSIQKGGDFKQLVRDCFVIVDTNQDDELTIEEWKAADFSKIAVKVHELFPLRPSAEELESVVKKLFVGSDTETLSTDFFSKLDDNGDGVVQRTEVGKAYNIAGRKFLEISKTIKQMGPMLAMFGGGVDMGGGGMRTEF